MKYKIIYIILGIVLVVIIAQLAFIYGLSFVGQIAEGRVQTATIPTQSPIAGEYKNVLRFIDRFKNANGGDVSVRLSLKGKLKSLIYNDEREDFKALFVDANGDKVIEYLYQKKRVPFAILKSSGEQIALSEIKDNTDVELVIDEHVFDPDKSTHIIYILNSNDET